MHLSASLCLYHPSTRNAHLARYTPVLLMYHALTMPLHPAFDPSHSDPSDSLTFEQVQVAQIEEQLEVEVQQLRIMQEGERRLDHFIRLMQDVRDDQVRLHARIDRLVQVIAGE